MPQNINGVVIPQRPTFDKIAALWAICKQLGISIDAVSVVSYSTTDPKDEKLSEYRKQGYYLVDVGENKYQTRDTQSAVETVVRDFNIQDSIIRQLAQIANKNNATGYLKSYSPRLNGHDLRPAEAGWNAKAMEFFSAVEKYGFQKEDFHVAEYNWSVAWLLREAYKVDLDVNEVIRHVFVVLDAWYELTTGEAQVNPDLWAKRTHFSGRITWLYDIFGQPQWPAPLFTVPSFFYQLVIEGGRYSVNNTKTIEDEIEWWLNLQQLVIQKRIEARQWAIEHTTVENLKVMEKDGRLGELTHCPGMKYGYFNCTEVELRELWERPSTTDPIDRCLAAIFRNHKVENCGFDCLIARNSQTGSIAILAGKTALDFTEVFYRLRGLENKLRDGDQAKAWHLDVKNQGRSNERQWLLNGSDNWPLPVTKIDAMTIIRFVCESTWLVGARPQR